MRRIPISRSQLLVGAAVAAAAILLPEPAVAGDSELVGEAALLGTARDHNYRLFPVLFGMSETEVAEALGPVRKRRTHLTVFDVNPPVIVGGRNKMRESRGRGFTSLEFRHPYGEVRALFLDGKAYRFIVKKASQRFHRGVRTGDRREDVVAFLGQPASERSLMGRRQIDTWIVDDGEVELSVLSQRGEVKLYWEQGVTAAREAKDWLWSDGEKRAEMTAARK